MAIRHWAPFNALSSIEHDMQEMLDRLSTWRWGREFTWAPSTDMHREEDAIVVRAELPGLTGDDIDVEVDGNVLRIKGEKREEKTIDEANRYLRECHYGSFERDVLLPEGVDVDAVEARYVNGVLTVRIPLPEEEAEATRKVKVDVTKT